VIGQSDVTNPAEQHDWRRLGSEVIWRAE